MLESWKSHSERGEAIEKLKNKMENYARVGIVVLAVIAPPASVSRGEEVLKDPAGTEEMFAVPDKVPEMKGMELLPAEVGEKIRTLLTQEGYYPQKVLRANVDAVAFYPADSLPLPEGMYTPSGIEDKSHSVSYFIPPQEINFHMTTEVVDYLFGHELGHLTDPNINRLLTAQERMEMRDAFRNTISHLSEEEVGTIRQIAYAQRQLLTRGLPEHAAVSSDMLVKDKMEFDEFWAAIAGVYFDHPSALEKISSTLFQFFDGYYKKFDASFNAFDAKQKRAMFIGSAEVEK